MIGNIYISGQIGTFDGVVGVELIDVIAQVKKQPEATSFNVHINSEGGLVDVGFDIYDYLQSLNTAGREVTTIGSGIVASIATAIFMAGAKRMVRENTPFMIHLPWGGSMGTADELEEFADQLRAVEKKLVGFYVKALDIDEAAISPLLKNETWLTQTQLADLGFTTSQPVMAAAKTYIKINKNMSTFTEKDKHWMESLFAKVLGKFKGNIVNKVVSDGAGTELEFIDVADDATIEVDMMANVDGKPAEGDFTMPSGEVYKFTGGKLTEIVPADEEEEEEENAEVAALREENEQLKESMASIQKDVLKLKGQVMSRFTVEDKKPKGSKKKEDTDEDDRTSGLKTYLGKKQ